VLDAQAAAMAQARPGRPWIAGHEAAVTVLTEGLLSLGLLKGSLKQNLTSGEYKRFYMHKTGHWIGLDVHDVGEYKVAGDFRELEPGMAFTIEPGLYIAPGSKVPEKYQGIGIRIEDDVLITKDGHRVLTDGVPKAIDAVEAVLAGR
jgi:Xaa-Pro aminopeptidase